MTEGGAPRRAMQESDGTITVDRLTKRFGSFVAVDDFSLQVDRGDVHGFLGPNGAGKSTTIRVLLGLYRRDGGDVQVLGLDPQARAAEVTHRISYVPGDVALWPALTGQQCLDALAGLRGRGMYDLAGEKELVEAFALDPSKRVRSYSKGNRQKVALVAAFAARTDLLILDEPTSGLDPLMEETFQSCVREAARQGRTVLLSSHILSEVEALCRRVTIIKDGRLVDSGEVQAMKHLAASTITASLASREMPTGMPPSARLDGGRFTVQAQAVEVPVVLQALLASGASSITCTPASLDELFLRHYEVGAR